MTHFDISRRALLGGTASALVSGFPASAAPRPLPDRLPARGNVVIRNAYVMTMEKDAGDLKDADVHVRDGAIVAVGQKLNAPGARAIDGRGMIVMPGLVGTYSHMGNPSMQGHAAGQAIDLVGNADMFTIMRTIQALENGKAENEFKLSARRVVELATIEGARSMGIDDKVGSLKAGKRADLIMIDTRAPNLGVFGDPAVMLVTAVQPANVDTVMIDGRILKRGGKLTAMNAALIAKKAGEANLAVRKRANWW